MSNSQQLNSALPSASSPSQSNYVNSLTSAQPTPVRIPIRQRTNQATQQFINQVGPLQPTQRQRRVNISQFSPPVTRSRARQQQGSSGLSRRRLPRTYIFY
jgi:hypothetical protein